MPKAILEFNLPEEQEEYDEMGKTYKYSRALNEASEFIRVKIKYTEISEETRLILEQLREILNEGIY